MLQKGFVTCDSYMSSHHLLNFCTVTLPIGKHFGCRGCSIFMYFPFLSSVFCFYYVRNQEKQMKIPYSYKLTDGADGQTDGQ